MSSTDFLGAKIEGRKLSMVTCYDYTFARLLSQSAIDGILVGDSAAMVMHGHPSTLSASIQLMRLHTEAVARGAPGKFIVADMPFLSCRKGPAAALDSGIDPDGSSAAPCRRNLRARPWTDMRMWFNAWSRAVYQ